MKNRKVKVTIEQTIFVDEDRYDSYDEFKSQVKMKANLISKTLNSEFGNQTNVIDVRLINGGEEVLL